MASEIVVQTFQWCDICLKTEDQEPQHTPATFSQVIMLGPQAALLELCEMHAKEVIGQLGELLEMFGDPTDPKVAVALQMKPGKPRKPAQQQLFAEPATNALGRPRLTTVCPIDHTDYETRSRLGVHLRNVHNTTLRELEGHPPAELLVCKHCPDRAEFRGLVGLGSHQRSTHPVEYAREHPAG